MNDDAQLDARVRRALQALPVPDDVRTGEVLDAVVGHRRTPSGERWRLALVAAVAVGLLVLVPQLLTSVLGDDAPAPAPSPAGGLGGTWSRTVEGARQPGWDGVWTIGFGDDGVLALGAPTASAGGTDGAAYAVSGAQVRVDAFVNGVCNERPPGTYSWSTSAGGLRLTALDDACAPRVELLAGTWGVVP